VIGWAQPATLQAGLSGVIIRMIRVSCALQYFLVLAVIVGSAQMARAQEEEGPKNHHEIRYEITLSTTPQENPRCEAQLLLTYSQKNTVAEVDTTLNNPDCGASRGDYTIRVRFRDENNELQSLEYPESWGREDDQPIEQRKEYFVGENVDLVSVRSRKLQCKCDAVGEDVDTPEE